MSQSKEPVPFDMNQATAMLGVMKHWTVKTVNRNGERHAHECTIWNGGRRVTGQGWTPVAAVCRALSKLRAPRSESRTCKRTTTLPLHILLPVE